MANNFLNDFIQTWAARENPQLAQQLAAQRNAEIARQEYANNGNALAEALMPLINSTQDPRQRALLENAIATGKIPNEDAFKSSLALRNIVAGAQSKNTEIPAAIKELDAYKSQLGLQDGTPSTKQFVQDFIFKTSPLDKAKYGHDVTDDAEGRSLQRRQMALQAASVLSKNEAMRTKGIQPKLKQGEQMNPDGTASAIPGSDLYIKQNSDYGDELNAKMTVDSQVDSLSNLILGKKDAEGNYVDGILSPDNADSFAKNFGWKEAYATKELPVAKRVGSKLDTIKANLKTIGLEMMRQGGSIGSMTKEEWPIVQDQLGSITPDMGEDNARATLRNVMDRLNSIKERANTKFETKWKGTQYYNKSFGNTTKEPVRVIRRNGKVYKQMSNDPNDWVEE